MRPTTIAESRKSNNCAWNRRRGFPGWRRKSPPGWRRRSGADSRKCCAGLALPSERILSSNPTFFSFHCGEITIVSPRERHTRSFFTHGDFNKLPLPRWERIEVRVILPAHAPHPNPLPQGERELSLDGRQRNKMSFLKQREVHPYILFIVGSGLRIRPGAAHHRSVKPESA